MFMGSLFDFKDTLVPIHKMGKLIPPLRWKPKCVFWNGMGAAVKLPILTQKVMSLSSLTKESRAHLEFSANYVCQNPWWPEGGLALSATMGNTPAC